ncbi:uncharacterized protein IAS62_004850 [Cryptococcus decagattii]|uniref:Uncharacterized protein n=1 Tax=Cryptococcus decagattii TaxID=1859122 RepID=A0ABZ2AY75_9TREE
MIRRGNQGGGASAWSKEWYDVSLARREMASRKKEEANSAMTEVQSTKGSTRAHDGTRQHKISRRSSSDLPFLALASVHKLNGISLFATYSKASSTIWQASTTLLSLRQHLIDLNGLSLGLPHLHLNLLNFINLRHIICSPDTKRMLLDLEPERERQWLDKGIRETKVKRFGGLAAKRGIDGKIVDRIEALPYGQPKVFTLGYENDKPQEVTIVLLDANHCPGSTMFLIASAKKAVLHTGDVRADTRFIDSLKRNPILQEFLAPISMYRKAKSLVGGGRRVLDRIYLDTAAMLGTGDMPDKEPILQELVEIMGLYPEDTTFFLNTWCFGWEDVIKEVARYFNERVHVDRYKSQIYSAIRSDPFLLNCTTTDPFETRFHACERFAKCAACRRFDGESGKPVYNLDKMIVHVNMVEMKQVGWDSRRQGFMETLFKAARKGGPWPFNIDIPISRHSTLPELQSLVKLFKPLALTPNTVVSYAKAERDHYLGQMYGKWYSEGLNKLRQQGFGVYPDVDKVEREEYYYKREDYLPEDIVAEGLLSREAQKVSGTTRTDISMDQVTRFGGLPSLSPEEIYNRASRLMNQAVVENSKPAAINKSDEWEYDTEEESMGRRKRRKRRRAMFV